MGLLGCSSTSRGEDEIRAWLEERSRGRFEGEEQAWAGFRIAGVFQEEKSTQYCRWLEFDAVLLVLE